MHMSRLGIDYAWTHPSLPGGCSFVLRYLSNDPTKNLSRGEADSLKSQGQDIGVVWETTTNEVDGGHAAGVSAAQRAEQQAAACGMPAGSPIYFAVDYDAQVGPIISAYFQGVAEVLGGVARVGVYGGLRVCRALKAEGLVTYQWQAAAWSTVNGHVEWDGQDDIEQYGGNAIFDWNRADRNADFGQWRTGGVAAAPVDMHPGARMIKLGDSGPDVASLQSALGITSDGSFGPATEAAVKALQAAVGLSVDGVVGAQTWTAVVYGAIGDKYRAFGSAGSALGRPLMLEGGSPDGKGRFVHFEHGSIYYSPDTGVGGVVILGGIFSKWATLGYELSFLGYPTTDEAACVDGAGRFQRFQAGTIYYSPAGVAASIHGGIYDHWASLNGESGLLGYPTSEEQGCPDGHGRFQSFDKGMIYWRPETGAIEVHGAILAAWAAEKWETGVLGYPTSDEHDDPAGGRVSSFQGADLVYPGDGHVYISRQVL
jgi:peptidoglycan hydrolase-like protein with peptidoglycan-binding domain